MRFIYHKTQVYGGEGIYNKYDTRKKKKKCLFRIIMLQYTLLVTVYKEILQYM
jgi:hypothetical protein